MSDSKGGPRRLRIAVVSAVDDNARYRGCDAYFIESWRRISQRAEHSYVPVLVRVTSPVAFEIGDHSYQLPGEINTAFLAQNLRSPVCGTLDNFDLVMTSDIDMFPITPDWFDGLAALSLTSGGFVIGRNVLKNRQFPICYNMASPQVWASLFRLNARSDLPLRITEFWNEATRGSKEYDGVHGGLGWHFDQMKLYELVTNTEANKFNIEFYEHGVKSSHKRLDRALRPRFLRWLVLPALSHLGITDYHAHLPVHEHRAFLDALLKAI